jgi:uncharacterized protein
MGALMYFPTRELPQTPANYRQLLFEAGDGTRLHGWWAPSRSEHPRGQILMCHGNAGNIGDRVPNAELLCRAGFDVLLFDYRGYGSSGGAPDERGTYADARAARLQIVDRDPERVFYLGESLGGAVALKLALEQPPAGLILQSTFTSVRELGREHYPLIPTALVPDAYPNQRRISRLRAPLLILHGDRDEIVPLSQARELFALAPEPKRMHVFDGFGHNDLVLAGSEYGDVIADWAPGLG